MKQIKNHSELTEIINSGKPIMLDFYADWCGPCQVLLPVVEELAEENKEDFIIAKVNVDESPELAGQFNVRSIPALFFIQNGKIEEKLSGVQSKAALQQRIEKYSIPA